VAFSLEHARELVGVGLPVKRGPELVNDDVLLSVGIPVQVSSAPYTAPATSLSCVWRLRSSTSAATLAR
jgi:hypothetical protein